MKKLILAAALLLSAAMATAAGLTPAQTAALKAVAMADPTAAQYLANGNDPELAGWFNEAATTVVWRSQLTPDMSRAAIVSGATQLDALTVGKRDSLFYLTNGTINPSQSAVRAAIDDLCGSQNTLKAALVAAMKRPASRAEKALATGTGTEAAPALLTWEGLIGWQEAADIRNAP